MFRSAPSLPAAPIKLLLSTCQGSVLLILTPPASACSGQRGKASSQATAPWGAYSLHWGVTPQLEEGAGRGGGHCSTMKQAYQVPDLLCPAVIWQCWKAPY